MRIFPLQKSGSSKLKYIARNFIILFIFVVIFQFSIGFLTATEIEKGKFGLQDFEGDVQIAFGDHHRLPPISDLHKNLCTHERSFKAKEQAENTKSTTNFILAKLIVCKNDGVYYEQQLHEMMNTQLLKVFDSASNRSNIQEYCKNCDLTGALPSSDSMVNSYKVNVAPRVDFAGLSSSFDQKYQEIKKRELEIIIPARQALTRVTSRHAAKIAESKDYMNGDVITEIEEDISNRIEGIKKEQGLHKAQIDSFVGMFWHSEPRLLSVLRNDERIPAFLKGLALAIKGQVGLITLHLHSTHDICDNCRLQLTGATYQWLYKKMVSPFLVEGMPPPLFHLIVSWYQAPKRKVDFKNIKNTPVNNIKNILDINVTDWATLDDTASPFSAETKPFVSIIKLQLPPVMPI